MVTFLLGSVLGFLAATAGGALDQVISRSVDAVLAIPPLIFGLVVLSVMPSSIPILIAVMGVLFAAPVFRVARAVAMDVTVMEYVEVARLRGEGSAWIMGREILPNGRESAEVEVGRVACVPLSL